MAWPVLGAEFGLPTGFASVYSTIVGVCTGGASFIAGIVIRKFGTPIVSLLSIVLTAVGLIGISLSPNIWVMIFFAIVLGYGAGAIDTGLNNYVSLHYKARHMNWLHCFWGIGVTASPMIMSVFLGGETGSWRNGYRVVAALELLIGILVLFSLKKWRSLDTVAIGEPEKKKVPTRNLIFSKCREWLRAFFRSGFIAQWSLFLERGAQAILLTSFHLVPMLPQDMFQCISAESCSAVLLPVLPQ